jgi:hypothetical protein
MISLNRLLEPLLTFEATLLSESRIKLAGLVHCDLPIGRTKRIRRVFVTQEINDVISGRSRSMPAFPSDHADLLLGTFVDGLIVGASSSHQGRGELKWLQNIDETWVFAFRQPAPGWRLFGRFASKNTFVGLRLVPREDAGGLADYAQRAREMHQIWDQHFPGEKPFRASRIDEYLGDMWVER